MTKKVVQAKQKNKREGILVGICVVLVAVAVVNISEVVVILGSTRKTFRLAA
jgi:hypothetical protein